MSAASGGFCRGPSDMGDGDELAGASGEVDLYLRLGGHGLFVVAICFGRTASFFDRVAFWGSSFALYQEDGRCLSLASKALRFFSDRFGLDGTWMLSVGNIRPIDRRDASLIKRFENRGFV